MDDLLQAADHRPDHLRRHRLAAGDFFEQAAAELLEGVECPLDHRDALGAGRVDLDEAHLRGAGLGGDQLQERLQGLLGALLAGGGALGLLHDLEGRLDQRLGRGQEALLLVLEVPVEGAAGDPGELDQVGDRGRLVALLGDRRDHRREEPLALVAVGLVAGHATARTKHSRPQLSGVPPRRPSHLGGP